MLCNQVSGLEAKFQELDDQIGVIIENVLKQNSETKTKITSLESDLIKLLKLVHELQCAQKLQMHFGGVAQGGPDG
jgi:1-aminocyclopropane-1-carboxylate deaminase/D-cysteine desulfhydrase-like pyridoxal-dependent ACC family enzyme